MARRAGIVAAELDGDEILEGKQVVHHRVVERLQLRQLLDEFRKMIRLVVDGHGKHRTDAVCDLVDNSESAIAGPDFLHQIRLRIGYFQKISGGKHHLHAGHIGADLPIFAREGRILGPAAGRASGGQVADFGVHVELQILFRQRLRHVDVDGGGLDRDGIGTDVQDPVHLHPDQSPAFRSAAGRGRMIGADGAHRGWILSWILQNLDDVIDRMRIHHDPWMRNDVAKPVGNVRHQECPL